MKPTVSIILPTYNRARFLAAAIESIRTQSFQDWELIVVDDGSTDNTREFVAAALKTLNQPSTYIYQANQGPYGARNAGLDKATGRYVAFFDSDDVWLPHHLQDCVRGLEQHPEVGWTYGSCRMVDDSSGTVLADSTFYDGSKPRPFLHLRRRTFDRLHVIDDKKVIRCAILHGIGCGLQNSVIHRGVFENYRFPADDRNEAEDQVVVVHALLQGWQFAYLDNVHVIYKIHGENSSGSAKGISLEKQLMIRRKLISGFENMKCRSQLSWHDGLALNRRLADEYFWKLGYAILWRNGYRSDALQMFHRGLALRPWNLFFWKAYFVALGRMCLGAKG